MTASFETERDDADLAAEYALGVLDGAARRSAEWRAVRDAGFAREIEDWQARLGPLTSAVPAEAPSPAVWSHIAGNLDRMTRRLGAQAPAEANAGREPRGRTVSAVWQWLGIGGMGLAVASLAALIALGPGSRGPIGPGTGQTFTAMLASDTGAPLATVVIDPVDGSATLIPVANPDTAGRVPELWLVPAGGGAPKSLGLVDMTKPLRLQVKMPGLEQPNAALAVSMEPPGGSPTGAPTGPVVASGPLNQI